MVFRNMSKSFVEQTKNSHLIQKQQHFCSEVIFDCLGEDLADLQMIYCLSGRDKGTALYIYSIGGKI